MNKIINENELNELMSIMDDIKKEEDNIISISIDITTKKEEKISNKTILSVLDKVKNSLNNNNNLTLRLKNEN